MTAHVPKVLTYYETYLEHLSTIGVVVLKYSLAGAVG